MSRGGFFDFLKPLRASVAKPRARNPLDGAVLHVPGESGSIPVAVTVRPSARRMILRIDRRTGGAALTLPKGVGKGRAESFLASYAGWLKARLQALPARVTFEPETIIPVRGVPCRIVHRLPFRGETRLEAGEGEALLVVHGDPAHVATRVLRFLKQEALADLTEACRRRALDLGVTHGRISIKDTRSRWGSCSSKGDLSFSWRLILAPPHVLDYLAVHELAHRLEMNHSTRYWRHVRLACPDFERAETWLNRNGQALHGYG